MLDHLPAPRLAAPGDPSAEGVLKRSDFGVSFGIPVPPDTIGVSDEVTVRIETEFMNPDAQGPEAGP